MSGIQRVVLCGTGPASIQLAITFKNDLDCRVGLAGRESVRSAAFYAALEQSGQQVQVTIQNEKHRALAGKCIVDQVFRGTTHWQENGRRWFWLSQPMLISMYCSK